MANSQLTDIGLQKFNTADPLNPVKITHIAVGDGNGSTPTVDPSRTSLVNEVYRGTASLPMVVSTDPKILRWELEIPATEGGFTVREACLIDEDGDILSFALTDPILKPDPATSIGNIYIVELNHTLINEDDDLVIDFNAGRGVPAQNVAMAQGGSLQDFADSFALKIFQSPTDGLTEINTRTLLGGEVYEVRKVSDGSLATIYTDKEGLNPIAQNGTSNVSGSDGVVEFHIEDGSYYLSTNNKSGNFIVSNLIGELDTLQDAIDSKLIKAGDSITIKERIQGSGGGGTWDVVLASSVTIPPEAPSIGDVVACSNIPSLALKLRIENNSVHCKQIGAKFNGSFNDLPAVQWAIDNLANKNSIELSDEPRFESELKFPVDSRGYVMFSRKRITVNCDHNGNGLSLGTLNENYGGHVISNISFDGPNVHFPDVGYTPVSAGYGVNLEVAYFNTFLNCVFTGFLAGVRISRGFSNKFIGDCSVLYNQYGVFLDNGPTNVNDFSGMRIRQNRKRGVFIDGSEGGPYPTRNKFNGAYIESNIPYNGGYPVGGTGDGETSTGVYINRAYDNDFTGTYFENQEYDVWLQGQTSGNKFNNTRHSPSADYSRLGKIRLSGENCNNNSFNEAIFIARNSTDIHVESDNSNQLYNTFYDTTGINFINSSILAPLDIRNNSPYLASFGTPDGTICRPTYGYLANPTEGVLRGKIEGIGTDTATLHANGLGEVQIGSAITSDTTITSITGLKRGQMFVLWNYQASHSVKIKSTTSTGNLLLKGLRDAVFTDFGQCIVFTVNGLGRICEIGRNFKDEQSGTATIPSGATSIVVPLPYNEPDFAFKVFVNATGGTGSAEAKGSVYVSGRNLNNITIATTVAPGGDGIKVDWMLTRNY